MQFVGVEEEQGTMILCEDVCKLRRAYFGIAGSGEGGNIAYLPHVIYVVGGCGVGLNIASEHGRSKHGLVGECVTHIAEQILEHGFEVSRFCG